MKHLFLLSLCLLFYIEVTSQICPGYVRGMPSLPIAEASGYYANLQLEVPGETNLARADSCLVKLNSQFSQVLDDINLAQEELITTNWYQAVEYQQFVDGIPLDSRGFWCRFNNQGILSAMYLFMETDSLTLIELVALAAQGTEGVHMIKFIDGEYQLVVIQEIQEPAPPGIDGAADVSIEVTYPVYLNSCKDITISPLIPTSFSLGEPLKVSGSTRLDGEHADPDPDINLTFNFPSNDVLKFNCDGSTCTEDASSKYEALMCYYHLNHALEYIENNFPDDPTVEHVTFYRYTNDEEDAPSVYMDDGKLKINFSGNCENGVFHDIAEDADHIVSAAFESFMVGYGDEGLDVPTGMEHGVGAGTLAYWTWRYMVHKNFAHTEIGGYAGSESSPIDLLTTRTFEHIVPADNRLNASIWAATLYDIFTRALKEDDNVMNTLLLATARGWKDQTNQPEAAVMLYETAYLLTPLTISDEQFCIIGYILAGHGSEYIARYPQTMYWPENLEYFDIRSKNYYIKDTHEAQITIPYDTGEDRGTEPNEDSKIYDRSPVIWNCLTADCDTHERPRCNQTNYLKVLVSNVGCDWSAITGTLEAYASFAPWRDIWPLHWGGDVDGDGIPDPWNAPFWSHNPAGKHIGTVSIDNYVEDPAGNGRIYTIEWLPFGPCPYKTNSAQPSYLAQIVSTQDPIVDPTPGPADEYVKNNNNVARNKLSLLHFAEGEYLQPKLKTTAIIGFTGASPGGVAMKLEYIDSPFVHNASNFDSLGDVRLIFPENFLITLDKPLPEGNGHDWINDSTLLITGPDFALPIDIHPDSMYPFGVKYTPNGTFEAVSFRLSLKDEDGCDYGGENFVVNDTEIIPRSDATSLSIDASITGYPNPAYDHYTLDIKYPFSIAQMNVYNIMGQTMQHRYDNQTHSFSIANWSDGIYIVQVILSNGASKTLQFLKAK